MGNLYRETAEPAPPTPALTGEVRADVAIVGAGITGLSTALHLAEAGAHVVLVEAHDVGWGASGRNGGQVNPGLKHDPEEVERSFGADLGGRMNRLAGAAPQLVFDLISRHAIRCEARQGGTLRAAIGAAQAARLESTARQLLARGAPVTLLDRAGVAESTGTTSYGCALLDRRGGDLNPLGYTRGLARAALAAGALLHGETRVMRLEPFAAREHGGAARWRLTSARGSVLAAHVVIATNGYTDELWPALRRTIVPLFGAIAASAPLPQSVARTVMPGGSVLYETGAVTVYYRLDAQRRLLIGGRGPQREVSGVASLAHLLDYARRLWPVLTGVEWTHVWGGRLAMTRDHFPHVHEPAPGVLICLGYNGRGVALATALGAELARRITTPDARIDMPVSALRPIPLHALWPLAVKAAIARGRAIDWWSGRDRA